LKFLMHARVSTLALGLIVLQGCGGGSGSGESAVPIVTGPVLQSIELSPSPAIAGVGIARPLTATGIYTDGTRADVSREAVWSSANTGVASVAGGLVTGATLGVTQIAATIGQVSANVDLSVTANTWTAVKSMRAPRFRHTATLLQDGRVLVVGGMDSINTSLSVVTAEIYDPVTDAWASAAPMPASRSMHQAVLLSSGKVLIFAGLANDDTRLGYSGWPTTTCFLYDPASDTWTTVGSLTTARLYSAAALLPNGKVLVVGGGDNETLVGLASAELFDPTTGQWTAAASPLFGRMMATLTPLPTGKVLLAGGISNRLNLASVETYDPSSNSWTQASSMNTARGGHTGTLLQSGKVLVSGGGGAGAREGLNKSTDRAANSLS